MRKKQLLPFISNKELYAHVKRVLVVADSAVREVEGRLYKNVIDPFSALFDALRQDVTLRQWLEQEKSRQTQKTLQNALGDFHENVLGSIPGWEKLPVGGVVDVKSKKQKIIAEVKNKWNTKTGVDRKSIYDNLESQLGKKDYSGFTGYYVEIVPKRRTPYNKPFTPSDNVTGTRRPENEKIRVIDGRSFYELASGEEDALKNLYETLPVVINDILGKSKTSIKKEKLFQELFHRAY